MVFLGIEMVIFSALLVRSKLIPLFIPLFGIIAFALIFIYGLLNILMPTAHIMMLTLPSFLFELICGGWLLVKGISVKNPSGTILSMK